MSSMKTSAALAAALLLGASQATLAQGTGTAGGGAEAQKSDAMKEKTDPMKKAPADGALRSDGSVGQGPSAAPYPPSEGTAGQATAPGRIQPEKKLDMGSESGK
jgi:hypothetical protein